MANCNRLGATMLLIRCSLFPATAAAGPAPIPATAGPEIITPPAFAAALLALDRYLRPDGTLQLLFADAAAPAAPFLLFRLKRSGWSACQVKTSTDGLLLMARR